MKNKIRAILHTIIAALFISGAAICAAAQTDSLRKENQRETLTNPASPAKQETPSTGVATQNETEKAPQSPSVQKIQGRSAQYSYEFTQPNFLVNHVFIEHDEDGVGKITFERKNNDPIIDPLDLSPATVARLKLLWQALHFLDSDTGYQTERQYPHLGTMRLHMEQDGRQRVAEFNWTSDRGAFALVTEYKRIANQAMFVFDITLACENQPLEAPKLMDQFDGFVRRGELADPEQLVPLLRELTTDERIPLMARNHATRILKKIEK